MRPHIEYAVEVWNPKAVTGIKKIEKVQNKMTKLMPTGRSLVPEKRNSVLGLVFLQKWSNLHERSGIGWIERKTKFQIFRRQEILSNKTKKIIHNTHFILPITKGSINAWIKLVGFSTSNRVKNHCSSPLDGKYLKYLLAI